MDPWGRQGFDTDESFMWFAAYRDSMPPRQLSRVRLAVPGKVTPTLEVLLRWHQKDHWGERAEAWDNHLDKLRQREREAIVGLSARELAARDMALINEVRELASRELNKMLITSMANEAETMKVGDVQRLIDSAVKLGRLTRGESTENVNAVDLSGLPLADIKTIQEIRERARKK